MVWQFCLVSNLLCYMPANWVLWDSTARRIILIWGTAGSEILSKELVAEGLWQSGRHVGKTQNEQVQISQITKKKARQKNRRSSWWLKVAPTIAVLCLFTAVESSTYNRLKDRFITPPLCCSQCSACCTFFPRCHSRIWPTYCPPTAKASAKMNSYHLPIPAIYSLSLKIPYIIFGLSDLSITEGFTTNSSSRGSFSSLRGCGNQICATSPMYPSSALIYRNVSLNG